MNKHSWTRYAFGSLCVGLAMFMLAGLWNLLVFPKFGIEFASGLLRTNPIFPLIIIGYLALGAALTFVGVHSKFAQSSRLHWIVTGIIVMELAFGISSLPLQASYNFPLKAIPLDIVWYLIEGALGGLTASFFFKQTSNNQTL